MEINKVKCKSILSDSDLYAVDYSINPYTGCQCGCKYCYAVYMKRFTDHGEDWGNFVDVKKNAPDKLKEDIRKSDVGPVLMSSVTDPYQPVEKNYRLSREMLDILSGTEFPITILTKNKLVTRDLDVLKRFDHGKLSVGFTINFLEEKHRERWEPGASSINDRIDSLEKLHSEGIPTYVHVGPYFEGITDLEKILDKTRDCITELQIENLNWERKDKILETIRQDYPDLLDRYQEIRRDGESYTEKLKEEVEQIKNSGTTIRLFLD